MVCDNYILPEQKAPVVLVVDDQSINLDIISKILSKEGYRIATAMDGRQALDIAGRVYPDLVLLDVVMPEMDGYEVCKILKEAPETKDTPVMFITVKNEMEDILNGFEARAVDYVIKPFNSVELLAREI
jgi:CheY-like chemotaxis protein